jgi:hypothetical protein
MKKAVIYLIAAMSIFEENDYSCIVLQWVVLDRLMTKGITFSDALSAAIGLRREYQEQMFSFEEADKLWEMPEERAQEIRVLMLLMMAAVAGDEDV